MDEERFAIKDSQGGEVAGTLSRPGKDARSGVVLSHGFFSHSESSTNLALTELLAAKGIATVRFDFWGHGKSKGDFAELTLTRCVDQLERVLAWFKTKGIRKVGLAGSSFGGTATLLVAENHPELRGIALKCPVSEYAPIWQNQLGEEGMKIWRDSGVTSIFNEEGNRARLLFAFYEDLLQYDIYASAAQIRTPVLIVHGDADADVPVAQSLRLKGAFPTEAQMETLAGADHVFSKPEDFKRMTQRIADWVVEKIR